MAVTAPATPDSAALPGTPAARLARSGRGARQTGPAHRPRSGNTAAGTLTRPARGSGRQLRPTDRQQPTTVTISNPAQTSTQTTLTQVYTTDGCPAETPHKRPPHSSPRHSKRPPTRRNRALMDVVDPSDQSHDDAVVVIDKSCYQQLARECEPLGRCPTWAGTPSVRRTASPSSGPAPASGGNRCAQDPRRRPRRNTQLGPDPALSTTLPLAYGKCAIKDPAPRISLRDCPASGCRRRPPRCRGASRDRSLGTG